MIAAFAGIVLVALYAFTHWQAWTAERAYPPVGRIVDVGGIRLHATQRAPQGAPKANVLLVHGASGNQADMMAPLGDRLAALGYRVIAVDRPGHGWSERLPDDHSSPAEQARAIRAAAERLGVAKAIVVGHSWAGSIAVNFLLDHADFADGAVLLAPVTHPWPGGVRWYYKVAAAPVAGWLFTNLLVGPIGRATMDAAIAGVFAPQQTPAGYGERIGARLALRPSAFRANAHDVAHLRAFLERQAPRMGTIRKPVAIVTGDRDDIVLTERHSFGSARDIPEATLKVLPGVGHSPHWADPEAAVAAIESVFARGQSAREIRPAAAASAPGTSSQ